MLLHGYVKLPVGTRNQWKNKSVDKLMHPHLSISPPTGFVSLTLERLTVHHPHVFRLQGKLSISLGTYFEESLCRILVSLKMQYPYDGKNQHVQPISWPVGGVPHSQKHPNRFLKVGLCQISRISPINIPSNPALQWLNHNFPSQSIPIRHSPASKAKGRSAGTQCRRSVNIGHANNNISVNIS